MTRHAVPLVATLLLAIAHPATEAALPSAVGDTPVPSLSPMIKKVSPAVVSISTRGTIKVSKENPLRDDPFFRRFFDTPPDLRPKERSFEAAGSGVIIDAKKGYIVTNAHVIENASEITVTLHDGQDLKAEVVGRDVPSDVAVLKVKSNSLTQIALGDSDRIEVGDFVVAIGNPFGLQHTVTSGIVSGLSRSGIHPEGFQDFIQTDASINPGNSGGALVNLKGELIGINTAILSRTGGNIGIGFAIPVNMARSVMDELLKYGTVRRGLLGVRMQPVTPAIAQALGLQEVKGALISQVVENSAAERAGIRTGDVITSVNGRPVRSNYELRNVIGLLRVGDKVEITLLRDNKPRRVTAVIGENTLSASGSADPAVPSQAEPPAQSAVHRGLEGAQLADAPDAGGAIIRKVEPDSPAAKAGLRPDDVIISANRGPVTSLQQLRERAKDAKSLMLEVRRGKTVLIVPLK
jgi:Do/DeqQ family serine protease